MDDQDISQPASPRTLRRAGCAAAVLAIVVAVTGWAFAAGDGGSARVLVSATTKPAADTSLDVSTTTPLSVTTTSDGSEPTTTASDAGETLPPDSGWEPTTSTTPPETSPWPPGTVVGWLGTVGLTGTVSFTPSVAPKGTILSYTATLTNPTDHWVFGRVEPEGLALLLKTPGKPADMTETSVRGVSGTAPEFQHPTPDGLELGLLLAPNASYSFSNVCYAEVGYDESDYIVYAFIVHERHGAGGVSDPIVPDSGSFTVTFPPTGSTTTTDA